MQLCVQQTFYLANSPLPLSLSHPDSASTDYSRLVLHGRLYRKRLCYDRKKSTKTRLAYWCQTLVPPRYPEQPLSMHGCAEFGYHYPLPRIEHSTLIPHASLRRASINMVRHRLDRIGSDHTKPNRIPPSTLEEWYA